MFCWVVKLTMYRGILLEYALSGPPRVYFTFLLFTLKMPFINEIVIDTLRNVDFYV